MPALRDQNGFVIGAVDEGIPMFERGVRPWGPWSERSRPAVATDTSIEIDAPKMQDVIRGYYRLK